MKGRKIKGTTMPIGDYLYPRRQENIFTSYSNVVSNITYDKILHDVAQLSLRTMREDEERRKRKERQEEEECLRAIREAEETQRIRMEEENKTWIRVSANSRKK
jgi:hypothetical protein